MTNKNLVLLSYGSEIEYKRAVFCILSFICRTASDGPGTRIIVYTDQPEFFKSYLILADIEYVFLSQELLQEIDAGTGYFHRRKVAVIDLTFKHYPGEGLLFIDTDTFFIADPIDLLEEYKQGTSVMHLREYTLKQGLEIFTSYNQPQFPTDFIHYISGREFSIGDHIEKFTSEDYSWNSGVLGLNKDFAAYMPDVYRLTDAFYANSKWFISEQLAFSLILQRTTEIKSADQFVLHYWGRRQKKFVDKLLDNLFRQKTTVDLMDRKFILSLIRKWKGDLEADCLIEQAISAIVNQSWYFGLKKIIQITFKNPRYLGLLCKELMQKGRSV